jgi:S1-C subfamily serine protease
MSLWKSLFFLLAIAIVPGLPAMALAQQPEPPASAAPKAHRAIPDDNLAYPVLVMFKASEGSGFFLNADKGVYLVTAKHVLLDPQTKQLRDKTLQILSYSKEPSNPDSNIATLDLETLEKNGDIKWHPTQDVAVVRIGAIDADQQPPTDKSVAPTDKPTLHTVIPIPGVAIVKLAPTGIVGVDINSVQSFSDILVGNEVVVFGYPTSLGLAQNPQLDPRRPLLRRGMVAGLTHRKSIILDCAVYFGNSGGPVIQVEPYGPFQTHFAVIGVVSEYVPFADQGRTFQYLNNSGYSVAVPMDFVLELIKAGS